MVFRSFVGLLAATVALAAMGDAFGLNAFDVFAGATAVASLLAFEFLCTLWLALGRNRAQGAPDENFVRQAVGVIYGVWLFLLLFFFAGSSRNAGEPPDFDRFTSTETAIGLAIFAVAAVLPALTWRFARATMAED